MDEGTTFQGARRYFSLLGADGSPTLVIAATTPSYGASRVAVGCSLWVERLLDHKFSGHKNPERGRIVGRVVGGELDADEKKRVVHVRRLVRDEYVIARGNRGLKYYTPADFELMTGVQILPGERFRAVFDFKRC